MVKWKTFFVIFKGVSFARNWLRPESGLLKLEDKCEYYNFIIRKHRWTKQINSNNNSNNNKKKIQSKKKKTTATKTFNFFAHYSRYSTLHCCYFYLLLFPRSIKPQTFQTSNRFATLQPSKLASETGKGGGEAYWNVKILTWISTVNNRKCK